MYASFIARAQILRSLHSSKREHFVGSIRSIPAMVEQTMEQISETKVLAYYIAVLLHRSTLQAPGDLGLVGWCAVALCMLSRYQVSHSYSAGEAGTVHTNIPLKNWAAR